MPLTQKNFKAPHPPRSLAALVLATTAVCSLSIRTASGEDFFWVGDLSSSWSSATKTLGITTNTNWATSASGSTDQLDLPGSDDLVRFSATNASSITDLSLGTVTSVLGVRMEVGHDTAMSISGSTLSVGTFGINNQGDKPVTFNCPVTTFTSNLALISGTNTAHLIFEAPITGNIKVNTTAQGQIVFNTTNTYTNGTVINEGSIKMGVNNALPVGGDLTIQSGSLYLNGKAQSIGDLTFTAATGGKSIGINANDNGAVTLAGNIQYSGGSNVGGAKIHSSVILTPGVHTISNPNTLGSSFDTYDMVFGQTIYGDGGLKMSGAAMNVAITKPSLYLGTTTVDAGRLTLGTTNALPVNTSVFLNGGIISMKPTVTDDGVTAGNYNQEWRQLSGTGGTIELGTAKLTVGTSLDDTPVTFAGNLVGLAGSTFNYQGSGILLLTGNNSYSHTEVYSADGSLKLGSATALPNGSDATIYGTLDLGGYNATVGNIIIGPPTFGPTSYGQIIDTGFLSFAKLTVQKDIKFDVNSFSPYPRILADLVLSGGTHRIENINDADNNTVGEYDFFIRGDIQGAGGILKEGPLSLVLGGLNTYSGGTILNNGKIVAAATNTLPVGGAVTINAGTLDLAPTVNEQLITAGNYNQSIGSLNGSAGTINLGSATLTINPTADCSFSGVIQGTGMITKAGSNTLTLGGNNLYTGGSLITGGTLKLGSNSGIGTNNVLTVAQGTFDIAGKSPFIKQIIFGSDTYVGAKTITNSLPGTGSVLLNGNVTYNGGSTPGMIEAPLELSFGEHLIENPNTYLSTSLHEIQIKGPMTGLGSLKVIGTAGFDVAVTGTSNYSGATTVSGAALYTLTTNALPTATALSLVNGGLLSLKNTLSNQGVPVGSFNQQVASVTGNGQIDLGNAALTVSSNASFIFAGKITGDGPTGGTLIKAGNGTFTYTGNGTFTGPTKIQAGAFSIGSGQTSGVISGEIINDSLLIFNRADFIHFAQPISGLGDLSHVSSGTVRLSGALSYSGKTAVSGGGTLQLDTFLLPVTASMMAIQNSKVIFNSPRSSSVTVTGWFDSIKISSGSSAVVTPTDRAGGKGQAVLVSSVISITGGAHLDLTNNDMILLSTPEITVRPLVASWWNSGMRDGKGIGTSASTLNSLTTLAVVGNADSAGGMRFATYDGITLNPNSLIVKYTYLGDCNIDGKVNADDLNLLIAGIRNNKVGWWNGDNNYDGKVDGDDMANLLRALRQQGASLGDGSGTPAGGAVPEPAALSLLALPAISLIRRRRN